MEAEQLNALANTLADLSTRTRELRRYPASTSGRSS
jgi:hypothetical protein